MGAWSQRITMVQNYSAVFLYNSTFSEWFNIVQNKLSMVETIRHMPSWLAQSRSLAKCQTVLQIAHFSVQSVLLNG